MPYAGVSSETLYFYNSKDYLKQTIHGDILKKARALDFQSKEPKFNTTGWLQG